jgi:hypothetical protein
VRGLALDKFLSKYWPEYAYLLSVTCEVCANPHKIFMYLLSGLSVFFVAMKINFLNEYLCEKTVWKYIEEFKKSEKVKFIYVSTRVRDEFRLFRPKRLLHLLRLSCIFLIPTSIILFLFSSIGTFYLLFVFLTAIYCLDIKIFREFSFSNNKNFILFTKYSNSYEVAISIGPESKSTWGMSLFLQYSFFGSALAFLSYGLSLPNETKSESYYLYVLFLCAMVFFIPIHWFSLRISANSRIVQELEDYRANSTNVEATKVMS